MARRPRTPRRRRIAGTFRFHERQGPDPGLEDQRLSLFLPAVVLDHAAEQAARQGTSVQIYCEGLLRKAVEEEEVRRRVEEEESRRGPLEGLHAIAEDAVYLSEWKASARPARARFVVKSTLATVENENEVEGEREDDRSEPIPALPSVETSREAPSMPADAEPDPVAEIVFRHAGLGLYEDPSGVLPCLRRGESIAPASARELLTALSALEQAMRESSWIDRKLAYALHRLAFEGQILLTDGWRTRAADAATVDVLHLVQEGVDRVLSGEDIRYYPRDETPGVSP